MSTPFYRRGIFWLSVAGILVAGAALYLLVFSLAIAPPGPAVSVEFDGQFHMDNEAETFRMQGAVRDVPESETGISNISVYFYADDGRVVDRYPVGELNTVVNITVNTQTPPKFVVIDSPDFWNRSSIEVHYYYRAGMYDGQPDYSTEYIDSPDEYPDVHT